ncbi:MAG: CPBP family intramembrane glutamic endopeptidase [Candidatus Acidiferrum sp.]
MSIHFAGHPSLPVIATHLLALHLIIVGPILDYFETRPLRRNPSPQRRMRYYRFTFVWLWVATAVACWAQGFRDLATLRGLGIHVEWLRAHAWAWWLLASLVAVVVILQLILPVVQVSIKYRNRPFLEPKQLEPLRFFLPSSTAERRWFVALGITAGFCEELLFRGFLLRYVHTWPLHLGLFWAILAAAIVFGTHHLYQGAKGVMSTSIGGLIFTAILIVTGSLWAGMLYHATADMSILLYWRPKPAVG